MMCVFHPSDKQLGCTDTYFSFNYVGRVGSDHTTAKHSFYGDEELFAGTFVDFFKYLMYIPIPSWCICNKIAPIW